MTRSLFPFHLAALVVPALMLVADDAPTAELPELVETRALIQELKLDEAEDAFKAAKKALSSRKRDKDVKAALKEMERNLEALEDFLDAREAIEKKKTGKALKLLSALMRTPGELVFLDQVAPLYAEVRRQAFYVINDFETVDSRKPRMATGQEGAATTEFVSDLRLSMEGRHSLKVTIEDRKEGVPEQEGEAWRWVRLKTPPDFAEKAGTMKALTLGIYSPRKQEMKLELSIGGSASADRASWQGIALNYAGWRTVQIPIGQMKIEGKFDWSQAKNIVFATRGAFGGTFYVDDVKLVR